MGGTQGRGRAVDSGRSGYAARRQPRSGAACAVPKAATACPPHAAGGGCHRGAAAAKKESGSRHDKHAGWAVRRAQRPNHRVRASSCVGEPRAGGQQAGGQYRRADNRHAGRVGVHECEGVESQISGRARQSHGGQRHGAAGAATRRDKASREAVAAAASARKSWQQRGGGCLHCPPGCGYAAHGAENENTQAWHKRGVSSGPAGPYGIMRSSAAGDGRGRESDSPHAAVAPISVAGDDALVHSPRTPPLPAPARGPAVPTVLLLPAPPALMLPLPLPWPPPP